MGKDVTTAKKTVLAHTGKSLLQELIRSLGFFPDVVSVADLQGVADRLSEVGQKTERPWTWRYLRSVLSGTVEPSKHLVDTMMRLGALVVGAPREAVMGVRVTILALEGRVDEGSLILGKSQPCGYPACKVKFVPVVPWQKCHSPACTKGLRILKREERKAKGGGMSEGGQNNG